MTLEDLLLTFSFVLLMAGFCVLSWQFLWISYRYGGWFGVGFCLIGLSLLVALFTTEPNRRYPEYEP